jgi:hypothetical protein
MNKIVFKSRYGNDRFIEFLDPNTIIIYGKTSYVRIIGRFEGFDFEGGPFVKVGTKLNNIIDTNYKKQVVSIEKYNKESYIAFKVKLEDY